MRGLEGWVPSWLIFSAGPRRLKASPDTQQRKEILEYLERNPGASPAELKADLEMANSSAHHHLDVLVELGLVRVEQDPFHAKRRQVWLAQDVPAGEPTGILLEGTERIARRIAAQPGIGLRELIRLESSLSERTVSADVARLVKLGLVTRGSKTRYINLHPTPLLYATLGLPNPRG